MDSTKINPSNTIYPNSLFDIPKSKIALANSNGITFVEKDNIIHIVAEGSYSRIKLKNQEKSMLISKPLKHFDALLNKYQFIRVHQSNLINVNEVEKYNRTEETIMMSDASVIGISRRRKELFFSSISSWLI